MEHDEWLAYGLQRGYCGPVVCATHDGTPTTVEEEDAFDVGDDPCIHIIRLYTDTDHQHAVEANHSPSVWRKP